MNSDELQDHDPCLKMFYWKTGVPSIGILNPLRRAICDDNMDEIMKHLNTDYYKLNLGDEAGNTCIHLAAGYASLNALKYFLSLENVRINVQNHYGNTPLLHALYLNDSYEVIKCLVDHNCDINVNNLECVTALHIAANKKDIKIGSLLIEKGANVDAKDSEGFTPLHEAVIAKNVDFVCMLLYYNASVNEISTYSKCTPFHSANKMGNQEIAEILFDYIDDFSYQDEAGDTFLSLAIDNKMPIAFDIINKGIEDVSFPFGSIICSFNGTEYSLKWIWTLLSKGVLVRVRDIECLHDYNGFCEEIEAIFTSEVPIVYQGNSGEFIQKMIYNCFTLDCDIGYKKKEKPYFAREDYVKSLLQLARDSIRDVIFDKYQNEVNFRAYNSIMRMDIPQVMKDILVLKRPIYFYD
nr:alpha-latrocrustotoxin-Lt1a-like isoform X2 [Onthophagus taurus]